MIGSDMTQEEVDAEQTDEITINKDVLRSLIEHIEQSDGVDLTPEVWKAREEPVPFTDEAVFPPYIVAGHLMAYKDGGWFCACHDYPPTPFNPYWGVTGHKLEAVGIAKYDAEKHASWITAFGDITRQVRLDRIAEMREDE